MTLVSRVIWYKIQGNKDKGEEKIQDPRNFAHILRDIPLLLVTGFAFCQISLNTWAYSSDCLSLSVFRKESRGLFAAVRALCSKRID
jgi:hypothetical protein